MLTQQEQVKFSRQIILKHIGEQGQLKLRNATVLIIGVGGLGTPASLYLAAAGVGNLILCDGDDIESSNLPRQILFGEQDVTNGKAETAADRLVTMHPDCNIEVLDEMLDPELADYYVPQADIVLDCTDNIATRYLINKACVQHQIPLVIGAATGLDGQHLFVNPKDTKSACYQCVFPESNKAPENNCQTFGILGPVLAMIGGAQALEAIKYLAGLTVATNQLSMFDGLNLQWQKFGVSRQKACPECGEE